MLISHNHKFIFIHIYKTAGTSVTRALIPYCRLQDRIAYGYFITSKGVTLLNRIFGWGHVPFTGFHKHATALDVRRKLAPDTYDNYFKFAFVRNPWDWLVSLYFYIRENRGHEHHKLLQRMGFPEFAEWYIATRPQRQIDFVTDDNGELIVDYIGKFEQLDDDMRYIKERLALDFNNIPRKNISHGRGQRRFQEYYDDNLRTAVESYFRTDIERFEYRFE